jgi:ribonuclease P protein component
MLPKKYRINKAFFASGLTGGKFYNGENITLRVFGQDNNIELENKSIFSIVVPSKIEKLSVGRHLVKRRVSAVLEANLNQIRPGFAVVVSVKKNMKDQGFSLINKEVIFLLEKANLLKIV